MLYAVIPIFLVGMNDDFGIAMTVEAMAGLQQSLAQFDVIENLAVERNPYRLIFV